VLRTWLKPSMTKAITPSQQKSVALMGNNWTENQMDDNRITSTPAWDALNAFDAENNVEPARTIAQRIAWKYAAGPNHPLVDDISAAIEDAMNLGGRRSVLEQAALRDSGGR